MPKGKTLEGRAGQRRRPPGPWLPAASLAAVGLVGLALAACAEGTGDIVIDGSSTVFPITEAMAEEFGKIHDVRVVVGVSGTGGGFQKFCDGETDISDASRPIKETEIEACAEAGIEWIELPVAFDGLSIMVNPENDFADCLTVEELNLIWKPESEGVITNWNQVREGFPDQPLSLYGAGTDSGTFDYFTQAINGEEGASRGDYSPSEDDNALVQGIAGDENALGYFGYAYYVQNTDKLKLVAVDGGAGCVEPTPESIGNGTYQPLSRPLFIYVSLEAAERPEVQAFIEFYLTDGTPLISTPEVGYVELPARAYELALQRLQERKTGSVFAGGSQIGVRIEDILAAEQ